jgi:hypothetical protein
MDSGDFPLIDSGNVITETTRTETISEPNTEGREPNTKTAETDTDREPNTGTVREPNTEN